MAVVCDVLGSSNYPLRAASDAMGKSLYLAMTLTVFLLAKATMCAASCSSVRGGRRQKLLGMHGVVCVVHNNHYRGR